ncbi:AAA family ATPase [Nocardioides sp.]|uniref:AAA family ATPase n=1 Tax=Nocardioides sp. TaxID=35761 RepID=UPI0039E2EBBA
MRGRRRVGKSRLVEEFVDSIDVPYLFFAATGRPVRDELRLFAEEVAASDLPGAALFAGVELTGWDAALRLLAAALPEDGSVVVLDEIPYLIASDEGFEGTLQRAFDRELARKHVLLIGIGSDLATMEALDTYGRPFHQRATEMVIPPLTPAEVGGAPRPIGGRRLRRLPGHRRPPPDLQRVADRHAAHGLPRPSAERTHLSAPGLRRAVAGGRVSLRRASTHRVERDRQR